jgi:hypothetical protein
MSEIINKKFASLAGICWHELEKYPGATGSAIQRYRDSCIYPLYKCVKCEKEGYGSYFCHPNFCADPRLVLEVMKKTGMLDQFILSLLDEYTSFEQIPHFLRYYILDTTGLLALKAIEWMEKQTEGGGR